MQTFGLLLDSSVSHKQSKFDLCSCGFCYYIYHSHKNSKIVWKYGPHSAFRSVMVHFSGWLLSEDVQNDKSGFKQERVYRCVYPKQAYIGTRKQNTNSTLPLIVSAIMIMVVLNHDNTLITDFILMYHKRVQKLSADKFYPESVMEEFKIFSASLDDLCIF